MKIKGVKLSWKVLNHDFNSDKIVDYDIFWNGSAEEIAKRIKREKIDSYDKFKESMRTFFMRDFWSRTEYEILVSGLHTRVEPEKIDVWYQLEMNLDNLCEYLNDKLKLNIEIK